MTFLLLNQAFYPDVASSAQHLSDLARGLVERGHQVTVVASRRSYDAPEKTFPKREIWEGINIVRVPGTGLGKGSPRTRCADFGSFIVSSVLRLTLLPRHDVVIALTSPPLIGCVGASLAWVRSSRFVYWIMDLNPDEAVAAGWLRPRSLLAGLMERLSRFALRRADRIIALDVFMQRRIMGKGISASRLAVIPPWSHDEAVRFDSLARERFRKEHGLHGKFVIMHSGNHSPCHPLGTLLKAAAHFTEDPSIVFCFSGGGNQWREMSGQRLPPNVFMLPYQPLSALSGLLSAADLHVVVMGNRFVGIVHPCKIYNVLRVGAPVLYIGPEPSPVSEVLRDVNGDVPSASLRHGDIAGVVRYIKALRRGFSGLCPQRRTTVARQFSRAALLPKFLAAAEGRSFTPSTKLSPHEPYHDEIFTR